MRAPSFRVLAVAGLPSFVLAGCPAATDSVKPDSTCEEAALQTGLPTGDAGAPQAGVAEGWLDLPIGTPLSGYTSRCSLLGASEGNPDHRGSNYVTKFAPSAGVQSRIPIKVIWLSNGDQDLVLIKTDVIYSFDGLVEEMERRLSADSGKDLDGKVVVAGNHSHSSYGDFSDQVTFYLGSDMFNDEVFQRMSGQLQDVADEALANLQPVKLGVGYAKDWDPDDQVYHDRRDNNDTLQVFDDIPAGPYKDPYLSLLRIDTLDDQPLAVLFDFGIHGTTLGGDNPMVSVEAPGFVESVFEERFSSPVVVMHVQGGAGDASPSGGDDFYASLETTGEHAADAIEALWSATPTSADPITLETASRAVPETSQDIHVTRGGAVDWYYLPYDPNYTPDGEVYADDGSLLSPLDEFNSEAGEAFCGEDPPYLPGFAPADVFPYNQCISVVQMASLIENYFGVSAEKTELPLRDTTRASVTATRLGGVHILDPDGSTTTDDVLVGFFPGEPTAMYTEMFRRRAKAEAGYAHVIAVGYAQDHEGYLLIPEDWLMGGYEADITIWGPLQAEHIMEQMLTMVEAHLSTPQIEKQDPCGVWQPVDYGEWTLPTVTPDLSPDAGTVLSTETEPDYIYSPLYSSDEVEAGVVPDLSIPTEVPRVQGLFQMAWSGGDPGVDWPVVTLEYLQDGTWVTVQTLSGRDVSMGPDILLTETPDPLYPATDPQTFTWYAAWQAVGHVADRAGIPLGTYRLHVRGQSWSGGDTTWPWTTTPYEFTSAELEVVPAAITVTADASTGTVTGSLVGPERGYRLIGLDGALRGNNPLPDDLGTISIAYRDGSSSASVPLTGTHGSGVTTFTGLELTDAVAVTVTDEYGNTGTLSL